MKKDTRIKQWLLATVVLGISIIAIDRVLYPAPPVASWTVGEMRGTEPYRAVAPETPITLDLSLPRESWVYAVTYDLDRGTTALFPSGSLLADQRKNPVPAGNHILPGSHQGNDLSWHSGDMPGVIEFLVVVSDHPLPELEQTMKRFRQMGNAAFPLRTKLGIYAPKDGMKVVPSRRELHTEAFKAAHAIDDPQNDGQFVAWAGHPGVYLKSMQVANNDISIAAKKSPVDQVNAMQGIFMAASKAAKDGASPGSSAESQASASAAPPQGK